MMLRQATLVVALATVCGAPAAPAQAYVSGNLIIAPTTVAGSVSRVTVGKAGDGGRTGPRRGGGAIAPVPEPQSYALLLAGLGAVGFVARRRRFERR